MLSFTIGYDNQLKNFGSLNVSLFWIKEDCRQVAIGAQSDSLKKAPFRVAMAGSILAGRVKSEGEWYRGTVVIDSPAPFLFVLTVRRSRGTSSTIHNIPIVVQRSRAESLLEFATTPFPHRTLSQIGLRGFFDVPDGYAQLRGLPRLPPIVEEFLLFRGRPEFGAGFRYVRLGAALVGAETQREIHVADEEGNRIAIAEPSRKRLLEF